MVRNLKLRNNDVGDEIVRSFTEEPGCDVRILQLMIFVSAFGRPPWTKRPDQWQNLPLLPSPANVNLP